MIWTPDQQVAISRFADWRRTRSGPLFNLQGYAGTGKTTLIEHLAPTDGSTAYATYTGKAASVLRSKGVPSAQTIHSLIYKTIPHEKWVTGRNGRRYKKIEFSFELKTRRNSTDGPWDYNLIVIDEASMVGVKMARDLLSFGVPILIVGDPFQLPPVRDSGSILARKAPDAVLREITRQAAENPIIRLSMSLREGKTFAIDPSDRNLKFMDIKEAGPRFGDIVGGVDQLICGFNKTRKDLNVRARKLLGFSEDEPCVGDRVMCLLNDYDNMVMNGEQFVLGSNSLLDDVDNLVLDLRATGDEGSGTVATVELKDGDFEMPDGSPQPKYCFGYLATCHKAQGSQWQSVAVLDERRGSSYPQQWIYTAVTRAAENLLVISVD